MTDETAEQLLPHVELFIEQVLERDLDAIDAVLAGMRYMFKLSEADTSRAVAVVLAELLVTQRDRAEQLSFELGVATRERDSYAKHYLEGKSRVRDLRTLLNAKTAASTAKHIRKQAA